MAASAGHAPTVAENYVELADILGVTRRALQNCRKRKVPPSFTPGPGSFIAPDWSSHEFGVHTSEHGEFEVTVVADPALRVQLVLLSHSRCLYRSDTPLDAELRAFHEGVISTDLGGQQEFSWGRAFCRRDPSMNKDLLVLAYAPGPQVPSLPAPVLRYLESHESAPQTRIR